jgi:hypothetical protein
MRLICRVGCSACALGFIEECVMCKWRCRHFAVRWKQIGRSEHHGIAATQPELPDKDRENADFAIASTKTAKGRSAWQLYNG